MTTEPEGRGNGRRRWAWALVLAMGVCGRANGGEHGHPDPHYAHYEGTATSSGPRQPFGPAGGWHPDGGGVWHWWNPCCFPRCGGPDDYCRKPPPRVCWPAYPPYYVVPAAPCR